MDKEKERNEGEGHGTTRQPPTPRQDVSIRWLSVETAGPERFSVPAPERCVPVLPETTVHFRPVHHIPPRCDVVRSAILVVQIIGVLPHVETEHRSLSAHDGTVLIR